MPHIQAGDIRLNYEIHGTGSTTLTLIRGLGASLSMWYPQVPEFSRHFRTLVFDNRGVGQSDKPDVPYSTPQMASDLKNLLDALEVGRTALLGVSMGGMIAQEFALCHPEMLSGLILGCTSFGGSEAVPIPSRMWEAILTGPTSDKEVLLLQEQAMYCDDTIRNNRSVMTANNAARSKYPTPRFALLRQAAAISEHDASDRVAQIPVPTLVVTGKADRLIPPENSRRIAAKIPGAKLLELPGGHLFSSEYPEVFNRCVIEFVKEIT